MIKRETRDSQAGAGSGESLKEQHLCEVKENDKKGDLFYNKSNAICNLNHISSWYESVISLCSRSRQMQQSQCEITGCRKRSTPKYFPSSILSLPFTCSWYNRSISLNEMQLAITHYPINWSRHLTICAALGWVNYLSGLSVGSQRQEHDSSKAARDGAGLEESRAAGWGVVVVGGWQDEWGLVTYNERPLRAPATPGGLGH